MDNNRDSTIIDYQGKRFSWKIESNATDLASVFRGLTLANVGSDATTNWLDIRSLTIFDNCLFTNISTNSVAPILLNHNTVEFRQSAFRLTLGSAPLIKVIQSNLTIVETKFTENYAKIIDSPSFTNNTLNTIVWKSSSVEHSEFKDSLFSGAARMSFMDCIFNDNDVDDGGIALFAIGEQSAVEFFKTRISDSDVPTVIRATGPSDIKLSDSIISFSHGTVL